MFDVVPMFYLHYEEYSFEIICIHIQVDLIVMNGDRVASFGAYVLRRNIEVVALSFIHLHLETGMKPMLNLHWKRVFPLLSVFLEV